MSRADSSALAAPKLLRVYYAATLLFVVLDYFLRINVRLAFLDAWPEMRALYYLLCFFCLALMLWQPAWSLWIGLTESALSLSLLIIVMGVRVMTVTDRVLQSGTGVVSMSEILNFMIVGGVAWLAWTRGVAAVRARSGRKR